MHFNRASDDPFRDGVDVFQLCVSVALPSVSSRYLRVEIEAKRFIEASRTSAAIRGNVPST
jgi:hypothetical protein